MRCLLKFVMVALIVMWCTTAYSNPPTPSSGDTTTQPKTQTGINKTNPKNNKQPAKKITSEIEIVKSPVLQVETTDKTTKTRDYSSAEWWLVYCTGGLAFFTIALALFTFRLWKANIKLIESSRTLDRAYLVGGGPVVQKEGDSIITIQNAGRSPGFSTRIQWYICDKKDFLPNKKVSDILKANLIKNIIVVGDISENNVWPAGREFGLPQFKITDHKSHVGRILFGRVDFNDIFKKTHWSTFKLELIESGSKTLPGSYSEDWE